MSDMRIKELEAKFTAAASIMKCGHPRICNPTFGTETECGRCLVCEEISGVQSKMTAELTRAKARTAAVLREAAEIAKRPSSYTSIEVVCNYKASEILALITTDESSALQQIEAAARLEEAKLWNQFAKFLVPHDPGGWTQDRVAILESLQDRGAGKGDYGGNNNRPAPAASGTGSEVK